MMSSWKNMDLKNLKDNWAFICPTAKAGGNSCRLYELPRALAHGMQIEIKRGL